MIEKSLPAAVLGLAMVFGASQARAYPAGFPHVANHMKKEVNRVLKSATGSGGDMSCQTMLCLEPYIGLGTDGGTACEIPKQTYFNIRVYDPWSGYDPGLTAAVRGIYLKMCPSLGPNAGIAASENAAVGEAFEAP